MGKGNQKKLQSSRPSYPPRPLSRWKGGTAEQKRRGVEAVLSAWPLSRVERGNRASRKIVVLCGPIPPFQNGKGGQNFSQVAASSIPSIRAGCRRVLRCRPTRRRSR